LIAVDNPRIGANDSLDQVDIRLGDVVVSLAVDSYPTVIQYDMGNEPHNGFFEIVGHLNSPPSILLTAIQAIRGEQEDGGNALHEMVEDAIMKKRKLSAREKYRRPQDESNVLFKADFIHQPIAEDDCLSTCDTDKVVDRSAGQGMGMFLCFIATLSHQLTRF